MTAKKLLKTTYLTGLTLLTAAILLLAYNLITPIKNTYLYRTYPATILNKTPKIPQGCTLTVKYTVENTTYTQTANTKTLPCENFKTTTTTITTLPDGTLKITPPTQLTTAGLTIITLLTLLAAAGVYRLKKLNKNTRHTQLPPTQ